MAGSARSRSADPAARVHAAVARALERAFPCGGAVRVPSVCVGLSGGLDSMSLLQALSTLAGEGRLALSALHVHHGLSQNADHWATFCQAACRARGVPLTVARVEVDRRSGLGIEAAARAERWRVFAARTEDCIALGHHRDDQAETVLLQLLRGAGLRGLSAMPDDAGEEGHVGMVRLLRPLLDLSRTTLEAFARQQGLSWVDDESNADTRFDRNFVRHEVMPLLERRFPSARASLARSARLLGGAARLVESVAAADLQAALACAEGAPPGLSVGVLVAVGEGRACELLRAWLRAHGVAMPPERRLIEALRQVATAAPERTVEVRFDGATLRRYRDRICLERPAGATTHGHDGNVVARDRPTLEWNREARMALPTLGGILVAETVHGAGIAQRLLRGVPLSIGARAVEGGPALRIAVGRPVRHRTLKNLWQEHGVPPWQRDRWPLLRVGGSLACVPGVAVATPFMAEPGEPGWMFHWLPDAAPHV